MSDLVLQVFERFKRHGNKRTSRREVNEDKSIQRHNEEKKRTSSGGERKIKGKIVRRRVRKMKSIDFVSDLD